MVERQIEALRRRGFRMHLSEMTWTDVRDSDADVAVIPVGSTEQHGPHAPLGTDTLNAESVALAGADRHNEEVVIGPAIPVGVAEEHRRFDGTLWVSPDTFRSYVRETAASLTHHDIEAVVFVNGHGGNIEALAEVTRRLSRAADIYAVAFTWFESVGDHGSDMGHAGPLETALLRHTSPDLVREPRIEQAQAGAADHWGDWVAGVNLAHDSHEFTDNGVIGDPSEGDAQRGAELLELAGAGLDRVLSAVTNRE